MHDSEIRINYISVGATHIMFCAEQRVQALADYDRNFKIQFKLKPGLIIFYFTRNCNRNAHYAKLCEIMCKLCEIMCNSHNVPHGAARISY